MTSVIEISALSVSRGGAAIIPSLSLAVSRGHWFGLMGANGSGKTTLMRAVAGRLDIAAGSCRIEGIECAEDRDHRARAIGFAPPIEHLPHALTLRTLLELAGDPVEIQEHRERTLWSALGIEALLDRPVGQYSSGMRQRAAIALAFAAKRPLVFLDEPFNWLDPVAAFDARTALLAKVAEGLTLVTALHDLSTLCTCCHEGAVMANGRITLSLDQARLQSGRRNIAEFEQEMIAALR